MGAVSSHNSELPWALLALCTTLSPFSTVTQRVQDLPGTGVGQGCCLLVSKGVLAQLPGQDPKILGESIIAFWCLRRPLTDYLNILLTPVEQQNRSTLQWPGHSSTLNLKLQVKMTHIEQLLNGLNPDHWDTLLSPWPHTYLNLWPPWRTIPFYHLPRFGRTQPPTGNIRSGLNFPPVCIDPNIVRHI